MSDARSTSEDSHTASPGTRWVIGTDGSDCARHAARWAVRHAPGRARTIEVETVWELPTVSPLAPMGASSAAWDVGGLRGSAAAEADETAREMRRELDERVRPDIPGSNVAVRTDLSVQVESSVVEGHTSSALLDAAANASLLVLGSRGRGGFSRLVLGSTSTQCATHAVCPTAIIPFAAPIADAHRIVVAFDGSENSTTALHWAIDFATPQSVVECVMVWDVAPIVVGTDQFFFPEASDLARDRFHHLVEQVESEEFVRPGHITPRIVPHFVEGRPRTQLLEASENADLFVFGARGHGVISSALLGSVSTWLLHHVDRPMVVVPHPPAAASLSG